MATKRIYGIDLGTTYSCIAYVDEHGKPVVIPNSDNDLTTPSVVYFENESNYAVGQHALEQAAIHPERVVIAVKRSMGDENWDYECDGKVYRAQEISALILRKIVEDAKQNTGEDITDVVITCPAYFGLNQKEATKQAGTIAGLNVLYVIPEPVAAALAYGIDQEQDQVVLVYDLGGGTFDVTLIELKGKAINVLTTSGDYMLGGKNWDDSIIEHLAARFEEQTDVPADTLMKDPETYQELITMAEAGKKALSSRTSFTKNIRFEDKKATIELTRDKFNEITENHLNLTISFTELVLERAKEIGYPKIDKLLLVGGSTYMPQVMDRVKQYPFEVVHHDPNMAVAKGAAIFGYRCLLEQQVIWEIASQTGQTVENVDLQEVPLAAMEAAQKEVARKMGVALPGVKKLLDRTLGMKASKSFGIVVIDSATNTEQVCNLVVRDNAVPCTATETFGTHEEGQQSVSVRLMENELYQGPDSLVNLSMCSELQVAELAFERPLPKGSPIEVTFSLSPDGLLKVHAQDLTTGRVLQIEQKTEAIMNEEELEQARAHSQSMAIMR